MKKIRKKIGLALLLLTMFGTGQSAYAFLPFLGGGVPTIDGLTDGGMGVNFAGTKLNTVATTAINEIQSNLQTLQSKYNEYKNDFVGVMNSEQKAPLIGIRTIVDSIIAKKDDPEAVRRAAYDLFMTYGSSDFYEQQACDVKKKQFYIDTLIEINTAASKLEEEYNSDLKQRVASLSEEILTGENGAEVGDSNNSAWKNKYNVFKTYDDLLQMLEELTAMKAQYMVAQAVTNVIPQKKPSKSTEEKHSYNQKEEHQKLAGFMEKIERIALAQVSEVSGEETISTGYKYQYDPSSSSNVTYVKTGKTEQESPYASSREALNDLETIEPVYEKVMSAISAHNLIQALPSKRKNFKSYDNFVKLHDKSVERVKQVDQCVIQYLSKYYEDPEKIWNGVYIGNQITEYDLREGMSGWALASYEAAKEELTKADEETMNELAEVELDPTIDASNLATVSEMKESVDEQNSAGFKEKSTEEKSLENQRKTEKLAWEIGAEAAEMIATDQYSETPQWGEVKAKFPIWEDQKSFYGQYITGKYDNIKEYIKKVDLRKRTAELALGMNNASVASEIVKDLVKEALEAKISELESVSEYPSDTERSSAAQEKQKAIETLKKNRDIKLSELKTSRNKQIQELDETMRTISDFNADINRATIPGRAEDDSNLETYDTKELLEERGEKEKIKDQQQSGLSKIDLSLEQIKKAYTQKEQEIEKQYQAAVVEMPEPKDKIKELEAPIISGVTGEIQKLAQIAINKFVGDSNKVFSEVRDYAERRVEQTKNDILEMGDKIYLPSGGEAVLKRHKELLDELKSINVSAIAAKIPSLSELSGVEAIQETISMAYNSVITQHICTEVKCEEADENYFIGAQGKSNDFAGPKAAPNTTAAPMREVVYFDETDYANLPQLADGSISKDSLVNSDNKIPEVWKYMLQNPAYVEKDINLEAALNKGGEGRNYLRGGIMPCLSGENIIDVENDAVSYYLGKISEGEQGSYNSCLGFEVVTGKLGMIGINKLKDLELSENNETTVKAKTPAGEEVKSELGTLFTYKDNKLYYNDLSQKGYSRLKEIYESQDNEVIEENMDDALYKRAQFKKNQIGEFLQFAEREKDLRQQVEEMEKKIEETNQELITELTEAGFSPKEDFNILKDEDYEEAKEKLGTIKDEKIKEAEDLLSQVKTMDTEIVKTRVSTLKNLIDALKKDKNELLNISEATVADSSFDEELKAEEANQAVAEEYEKEAQKSLEDEINSYPIPYCAVY